MKDRDFLMWLHARLEWTYKENSSSDFMHTLRAIILTMPKNQKSPVCGVGNNLEELRKIILNREFHEKD